MKINIVGDGKVKTSKKTFISSTARFIFLKPGLVELGDYVSIGEGVKIICNGGDVHIQDWTTLHDQCLVMSTEGVSIGQHCWFGQNTIIDGTGGIEIGRGVRVGMYSQLWTHVAAGERVEGCTLHGARKSIIHDDVWLVGSCIVSSGVEIGRRTVALIGSNITKTFGPNLVLAGSPATVKNGLSFYRDIELDEKWSLLISWISDFLNEASGFLLDSCEEKLFLESKSDGEKIFFYKTEVGYVSAKKDGVTGTLCCLEKKIYKKTLSDIEARVLKYLAGNKARFDLDVN